MLLNSEQDAAQYANGRSRPVLAFAIVFTLIFGLNLIGKFTWFSAGELWAETGTVFFAELYGPNANPWLYIFGDDAGYLSVPQRLLVLVGYFIQLPISILPYFYELGALFIIALSSATLTLPVFQSVVPHDRLRFMLAGAIGLVGSMDTVKHISFTYLCVPFLMFVLLATLLKRDGRAPWWFFLAPLCLMSKPVIIAALFPVLLASSIWGGRQFRLLRGLCYAAITANVLRVAYSLSKGIYRDISTEGQIDLVEKFTAFVSRSAQGLSSAVTPALGLGRPSLDPVTAVLALLVLSITAWLWFRKRNEYTVLMVVGLLLILGNNFVLAFGLKEDQFQHFSLHGPGIERLYRWNVLPAMGGLLWLCGLIASYRGAGFRALKLPNQWVHLTYLVALIATLWVYPIFAGFGQHTPAPRSWAAATQALETKQPVCVLLGPYDWLLEFNCTRLTEATTQIEYIPTFVPTLNAALPVDQLQSDTEIIAISARFLQSPNHIDDFSAKVQITYQDGRVDDIHQSFRWPLDRGNPIAVMFPLNEPAAFDTVSSVAISANAEFTLPGDDLGQPMIDWYGPEK